MKPVIINYLYENPDTPASTPEEAERVLDEMQRHSLRTCPVLAMVVRQNDPETGPLLQVGVNGDKGLLTYGSGEDDDVISRGSITEGTVAYSLEDTPAEFPASAEIPYETVKCAVIEFLISDGKRPSAPDWQPWN